MFQSRISVIDGHNKDSQTDQLYDPLRKTFLEDTTAKKSYLQEVSRVSKVSRRAEIHSWVQNQQLGKITFIPEDVKLRPKSKLPPNRNYAIINAEEKMLQPITQEQFLKRQKGQEEVIVYTYGDQEVQEKVSKPQPLKRKNSGIKVTQPKYNIFSIIDEPVNNLLSGGPCTCPANELIASEKSQVKWQGLYSDRRSSE